MTNHLLGSLGELKASVYLKKKGFQLLHKNFRCPLGEIDLIGEKEGCLVFFEIKSRSSLEFGLPCESITPSKIGHISRTAQYYLMKYPPINEKEIRFDVIEILHMNHQYYVRHIENAFYIE